MSNKTQLQTNNSALDGYIARVNAAKNVAATLPEAGGIAAEPVIEPLEVTKNGTYTAPEGVDGYSPVVVTVPIPDGYIIPSGVKNITENGDHDVTEYASVNVAVPTGGGGNDFVKTLFEQRIFADENTTEIPDDAFRGWQFIKHIVMPNVKNISQYACYNCVKLTEIDFPVCETIGNYAFYNITDVVSINMPALKTTGTNAFRQLTSLVNLRLPSLTAINGTVFQKCTALEKADFSVAKSVGANAFNGCSVLTALILRGDSPITLANANALTGTPIADGTGYVYFNRTIAESQKTLTNWATYASQIRAIEDFPDICG